LPGKPLFTITSLLRIAVLQVPGENPEIRLFGQGRIDRQREFDLFPDIDQPAVYGKRLFQLLLLLVD
jgi:hypothetical protein